jgi:hypothetical protein
MSSYDTTGANSILGLQSGIPTSLADGDSVTLDLNGVIFVDATGQLAVQFDDGIKLEAGKAITGIGAMDISVGAGNLTVTMSGTTVTEKVSFRNSTPTEIASIDATGNMWVQGDFTVEGDFVHKGTEVYTVEEFFLMNLDNVSASGEVFGLFGVSAGTGTYTIDAGGFASTTTVNVVSTTGLSDNDFISISGANTEDNNGVYEVASFVADTSITIKNTPTADLGLQNAFTADVSTTGTIKVATLTYLRASKSSIGDWERASADNSGSLSWATFATTAGQTLQAAYEAGNTITMSAGEGNLQIIGSDSGPTPSWTFTATDAALTQVGTGAVTFSGALNVTDGAVTIGGSTAAAGSWNATTLDIDGTGNIDIDTSGGGISLDAGAASNFTSGGALTLTGAAASTWHTSAGDLTIGGASQAGSLILQSAEAQADAIKINASNAAGGIDVDSGTNGMAFNSTGAIAMTGVGLTLEAGTGAFGIEGDTASTINTTAADLTISTTTSGDIHLNAADDLHLDAAGEVVSNNALAAGEDLLAGDAVCIVNVAGVGKYYKCDADLATRKDFIGIVVADVTLASGLPVEVASVYGTNCAVRTALTYDVGVTEPGTVVYIDTATAGGLTVTPPSASGDAVFRVGRIAVCGASGVARIVLQPQYIAIVG